MNTLVAIIFAYVGLSKCQDEITSPAVNLTIGKYERSAQAGIYGLDDLISDPSMLDPEDVAVMYQLKMVTQQPSSQDDVAPTFKEIHTKRITTRAGQTATLNCVIQNLGNRQVSWIRGKDLHVLSSGLVIFASDERVSVSVSGSTWTLSIRYSQPKDAGTYACQINTQPPIASWMNLTVIEAKANIDGPSPLYIHEGSTITLVCIIKEELVIPGLVLWYHEDALVPRDSHRITIDTHTTNITISELNIDGATPADSGNYSCWPSSGKPDTTLVHVIQGDPPAAMQHGNESAGTAFPFSQLCIVVCWVSAVISIFLT